MARRTFKRRLPGITLLERIVRTSAGNNEVLNAMTRVGHAYRGMTEVEYLATVGAGRGVRSRADWSVAGEGTSLAFDAGTAEDYANFGRTDPRKTGLPTYLVEVKLDATPPRAPLLQFPVPVVQTRDGYIKARDGIPQRQVRRVWRMAPQDGNVVAVPVRPKRR